MQIVDVETIVVETPAKDRRAADQTHEVGAGPCHRGRRLGRRRRAGASPVGGQGLHRRDDVVLLEPRRRRHPRRRGPARSPPALGELSTRARTGTAASGSDASRWRVSTWRSGTSPARSRGSPSGSLLGGDGSARPVIAVSDHVLRARARWRTSIATPSGSFDRARPRRLPRGEDRGPADTTATTTRSSRSRGPCAGTPVHDFMLGLDVGYRWRRLRRGPRLRPAPRGVRPLVPRDAVHAGARSSTTGGWRRHRPSRSQARRS